VLPWQNNCFTSYADLLEKRGVRFRNEFLAFYLHTVTNVPLEVDHERRTVHGSAPVTTHESLFELLRLCTSNDILLRLILFSANRFSRAFFLL